MRVLIAGHSLGEIGGVQRYERFSTAAHSASRSGTMCSARRMTCA